MDPQLEEMYPAIYMAMIETADIVAERYGVSREYQDEYSLQSQQRMAKAQQNELFVDEIVPMATKMALVDKETKETTIVDYVVDRDECNRPDTTIEGLAKLKPVRGEGNYITAGNASQLSDGAAAVVLMSDEEADAAWLQPLGAFKGWAVAGCEPDEMGIGPVLPCRAAQASRPHRRRHRPVGAERGVRRQCLYSRDRLGIDPEKYNVNGGSIAVGHPFGMTGARLPVTSSRRASAAVPVGRRDDVHRRRPGRRRTLRNLQLTFTCPSLLTPARTTLAGGAPASGRSRLGPAQALTCS